MTLARKAIAGFAGVVMLCAVAAWAGWEYFKNQIRRNEHAPHLTRVHVPASDFTFRTLDGSERKLSNLKGKTVFVDLWGTWCIQCVAEMPTVQALYNRYRGDPNVVFLIISRLDSPAKVNLYAAHNGYDLPFYTMDDADIPRSMQLNQFPATFLYGPDGNLAAEHVGAADWSAPSVITFVDGLKRGD